MTQTQHDDFEDALLDLIYDELPAERAASLRAHAAGCPTCGASLARMTSARSLAKALPIEEPRPELTTAILARAREAMGARVEQARADAPAPRARVEASGRSVWAAIGARFAGFLVGPQAAMAVVTVLMVGIGLYYLPRLGTHHAVEGGRTVDPDPTGEAGPSAEISPAAPLDLRYDPRTRRIVDAHDAPPPTPRTTTAPANVTPTDQPNDGDPLLARADEHVDVPAQGQGTTPLGEAQGAAPRGHSPDVAGRVMQDPLAGGDSMDGVAQLDLAPGASLGPAGTRDHGAGAMEGRALREQPTNGVADSERMRAAQNDSFRNQVAQLAPSASDDVAPAPATDSVARHMAVPTTPRPMAHAAPPPSAPSGGNGYAPAPVQASPPPAQANAPTDQAGNGDRRAPEAAFAQNMPLRGSVNGAGLAAGTTGAGGGGSGGAVAYGRAPVADSEGVARPATPDPLAPLALHHRARTEATTSPQLAIRDYESLLARFPTYAESGTAMLELAELYRRTGEVGRARVLVTRAEAVPAARDNARRMRVQLDQMDRAAAVHATSVEAATSAPSSASYH